MEGTFRSAVDMIPLMADPRGEHWKQPPREEIVVGGGKAYMTKETHAKLKTYDISNPSGTYAGKMWNCLNYLSWFAARGSDLCKVKNLPIEIVEVLPELTDVETLERDTQDPKYVVVDGKICNKATKIPIPDDEPIFILRAKDMRAMAGLVNYYNACKNPEHRLAVSSRIVDFNEYSLRHGESMKEPDTETQEDPGHGN